jgi:hypothetical protein
MAKQPKKKNLPRLPIAQASTTHPWARIARHPLSPALAGGLITLAGHMLVQIWAIFICAIWLSFDSWFFIRNWSTRIANQHSQYLSFTWTDSNEQALRKRKQLDIAWRNIFFSGLCSGIFLVMYAVDGYVVRAAISNIQDEVFKDMVSSLVLPKGTDSMNTKFTITNNSPEMVHLKNITCHIVNMRFVNGWFIERVTETPFSYGEKLLNSAGQGAESFNCPVDNQLVDPRSPIVCGDMLWEVQYSLGYEPQRIVTKQYRYVLNEGEFVWSSMPLDEPPGPCKRQIQ